jgi:Fur family peroxide stress response transcriptional regulator
VLIYCKIVKEVPTLSKTTVYNTLGLFVEAKIVKCIRVEDNETRYDSTLNNHGHFKCSECGKVYDFLIDTDQLYSEGLKDFKITERSVNFKGICSECIKQE